MKTRIYNKLHMRQYAGYEISSVKVFDGMYETAVFPLVYTKGTWQKPKYDVLYLDEERVNYSNFFQMLYYHFYYVYKYHKLCK